MKAFNLILKVGSAAALICGATLIEKNPAQAQVFVTIAILAHLWAIEK